MARMIECSKLGKQAEGLERKVYPGEIGQRIYDHISKEVWQQWMAQQTILINENSINVIDPKGRAFIEEQMEAFLFGDGIVMPAGYTPPTG